MDSAHPCIVSLPSPDSTSTSTPTIHTMLRKESSVACNTKQKPSAVMRYIRKKWSLKESITSAAINLDHKTEEDTRKLTTVCLPYVRGLAEKIQKICNPYDIRMTFRSESTLRRHQVRVKPPAEYHMTKNCVYSLPCSCGKTYKGETCRPLKVRLEEHYKAGVRGEIEQSGMADHIWREKGNHLPLWEEVEIIDREEKWKRRRLKESAHVIG